VIVDLVFQRGHFIVERVEQMLDRRADHRTVGGRLKAIALLLSHAFEGIEPAEFLPCGPARHQIRVGDEDPGGQFVGPEHAHRFATLDQQGLVVLQPAEGSDNPLVTLPVPSRLPPTAVHDQLLGPLCHRGVEVVHQHPQCGFLVPPFAGKGGAGRCGNGFGQCQGGQIGFPEVTMEPQG